VASAPAESSARTLRLVEPAAVTARVPQTSSARTRGRIGTVVGGCGGCECRVWVWNCVQLGQRQVLDCASGGASEPASGVVRQRSV